MDSQADFLTYDSLTLVSQVLGLEDFHQALQKIQLNYKQI